MNRTESTAAPGEIKVAVIGAGAHAMGGLYLCLPRLTVDLMAVCDLNLAQAERVGRKFGARSVYTDYEKMLSEVELDAVMICIGPEEHAKLALDVMEAGLPVYTEKPPSVNAQDARAMLETSERTGQICMTAFCKRFTPAYTAAKKAVESPPFGPVEMLTIGWSCGPTTYTLLPNVPLYSFLLDFGIHGIDIARYLGGEVVEVYAGKRPDEGSFAVNLVFANGALGVMSMTDHRSELGEHVEVIGGGDNTIVISHGASMVHYEKSEVRARFEQPFAGADSLADNGYQGELAEFVDAVRGGRQPESSIASAYQTMRLYDAIVLSAAEHRMVELEEMN